MPRPKLQIVTDHVLMPRDNVPTIEAPSFPEDKKLLRGHLTVYLWVSKLDMIPFFIGIGTREHAHLTIQRIPGTRKNTIQQIYRELVGTDFLCIFVETGLSYIYALPLFGTLYKHYKTISPDSFRCNEPYNPLTDTPFLEDYPPSKDPNVCNKYREGCLEIMKNHTVSNMYFTSLPESIGCLRARRHYETQLVEKLQKQKINDSTYERYQESREQARRTALGEQQ